MSWKELKRSFSILNDKQLVKKQKYKFSRRAKLNKSIADEAKISDDSDNACSDSFQNTRNKLKRIRTNVNIASSYDSEEEGRIYYDPDISNGCNGCFSNVQRAASKPLALYNEKCHITAHTQNVCLRAPYNKNVITTRCSLFYGAENIRCENEKNSYDGLPFKSKTVIEDTCNQNLVQQIPMQTTVICTEKDNNSLTLKKLFANSNEEVVFDSKPSTIKYNSDNSSRCPIISKDFEQNSSIMSTSTSEQNNFQQTKKSNAELDLFILEIQKQKNYEKKINARKGGVLEDFRKAFRRSESDQAFWYHEGKIGLREKGFIAQVKEKLKSFGRTIVTVTINGRDVKIISTNSKTDRFLLVGSEVEIYMDNNFYNVKNDVYCLMANKIAK